MKREILLVIGAVISILFLVFAPQIYEMLYYSQAFSDWMYNQNMYLVVAIVVVLVVWILALLYYKIIDSIRFSKWYHWLIMFFIAILLAPAVDIIYPNGVSAEDGIDYTTELQNFAIINIAVTAVMFIIASFSLCGFSINCKYVPVKIVKD